jgi:hypothetical protein
LDFLGFSRPNLDLSTGYTGKASKVFSWRFLPLAFEARERSPTILACGKTGSSMEQRYPVSDFLQ